MKFLLDQGLPRSAAEHLERLGLEAEHVGELGLARATDEAILAEGKRRGAIVVTLDSDFHALLAVTNASAPSVLRIQIEGLRGPEVAVLLHRVALATKSDLEHGAAVTVTTSRIRLRRLPLLTDNDSPNAEQ